SKEKKFFCRPAYYHSGFHAYCIPDGRIIFIFLQKKVCTTLTKPLATWKKNDKKAVTLIVIFSVIVFVTVSILGNITLTVNPGFNAHVFAEANAVINSTVALLLLCGLIAVKTKRYFLHKRIMLTSMLLSILFLISYICHHL